MKNNIKISAGLVKELREKTGASVMECRNALGEGGGDIEKAIECLKKRGNEKAAKKAERQTAEGIIASYVHSNKKIGAMLELLCETDFVARNEDFQRLAADLAMHIAAMNPKYLSFESVSKEEIEEFENSVRQDLASEKKPPEIIEKIVLGKIRKHFEEMSLLSQNFIKDPDKKIANLLNENISKMGENIKIGKYGYFSI